MNRSHFLMVYPKTPDTYWSYKYALPFINKKALIPPLGLATIAAMVPDEIDCRIVDLNIENLTDDEILAADLVLVSAMIVQQDSFSEVVARCNRLSVPVAAGGPYPTSCQQEIAGVDYLVLGEGEISFRAFLEDYAVGRPKHIYRPEDKPDLCETPTPRFDLLSVRDYETMPVQFSRGCPFDCEFCDIVSLFGRKTRTKPADRFLRELDAVYETGFRGSVFIVDDNFIGNKRIVKELLHHVIRWQADHGYPFRLSTEASINLAGDDELLDLMVQSGFTMVFIGIESPSTESLAGAGKAQNLALDVKAAIRKIQERDIEVTAGFIIGFDTDPVDIFQQQIAYVQELAVPTAMVGLLMALPNTKLHKRLSDEGRMLSDTNGNNTHGATLNFVPRLPRELLEEGYRHVLSEIYRPRRYFDRCLSLLDRVPSRSPIAELGSGGIGMRDVAAFIQSLTRQTFSWYGPEYVRYIVRAFWKRPLQIVHTVTMAVLGHHFMTITRKSLKGRRRWNAKRLGEAIRTLASSPVFEDSRAGGKIGVGYGSPTEA